jgi:hypothetical protein
MKSIVLRLMLVLAAFMAVPNAFAADTGGGNVFLDAKFGALIGKGNSTGDVGNSGDSTTASGADVGYLWKLDDVRSLGFELGYMHFGQISNDTDALSFVDGNTTASAITAGVRFKLLLGDDKATILQLHGGLAHTKFTSSFSSFTPGGAAQSGTSSSYKNGPYFGVGVGRQFTQSFSVLLAYNNYSVSGPDGGGTDLSANWIGLVVEYQF